MEGSSREGTELSNSEFVAPKEEEEKEEKEEEEKEKE
jgi:hypothetical protein